MKAHDLSQFEITGLIPQPRQPVADTFVRIEDKFFIKKSQEAAFLHELGQHLEPSYPDPKTRFTTIQSTYFDSADLEIYHSHFQNLSSRFKLRTRRYAPDGIWQASQDCHLELKAKKDGVSRKSRFKLGKMENLLLMGGMQIPLSNSLLHRNSEIKPEKITKRLARVNHIVEEYALKPVCAVIYNRLAFEKGSLRVTLDNEIQHRIIRPVRKELVEGISSQLVWEAAMQMKESFEREKHVVVEIKHDGRIPSWLLSLMSQADGKEAKFSKYCFSMSLQISDELKRSST